MPETMTLQKTVTVDETSYVQRITATGKVLTRMTPSVPAAKVGSLTTRTDNDTGTATMATGHGFSTGNKVDLFWSGGSRRNMTATVTGDSVALDGGSGDNLPAAATAITAMVPTEVTLVVTGDNVTGVSVSSPKAGYVVFVDDGPADIADATYKLADGEGKGWVYSDGTNPLAGDAVTKVKFSHGDSSSARTMTAAIIRD